MIMRLVRGGRRLEDATLVLALLLMLGIALMQIVLRNLLDTGFIWADSFLRVLVLWIAILGAMVATRESNHISIDAVSRFLPPNMQVLLALLTDLFAGAICGVVAWYSMELIRLEFEDNTIAFGIVPVWLTQVILPFGFSVMALRFFANIAIRLRAG